MGKVVKKQELNSLTRKYLLPLFSFLLGLVALYFVYFITPLENITLMKEIFWGYGNHILISVFVVGNTMNSVGIYLQEKRRENSK